MRGAGFWIRAWNWSFLSAIRSLRPWDSGGFVMILRAMPGIFCNQKTLKYYFSIIKLINHHIEKFFLCTHFILEMGREKIIP